MQWPPERTRTQPPAPRGAAKSGCSSSLLLQPQELRQQLVVGFGNIGIRIDAFDRTHHHALRLVEMPHALGAARGVDHVDGLALRDGLVRAGGLADVAVDAELVDAQCHGAIVDPACAVRRRAVWPAAAGPGPQSAGTKTNSTPAGDTASATRSRSAGLPMNSTRTPFIVSGVTPPKEDRKSTRLNSSHVKISYAVFCLKKKRK